MGLCPLHPRVKLAFGALHFGDDGELHGRRSKEEGARSREDSLVAQPAAFGCLPRSGSLRGGATFRARAWSLLRMTCRVALATVRLRRGDELAEARLRAEGALDAFEREAGGEFVRAELHAAYGIDRLLAWGRMA